MNSTISPKFQMKLVSDVAQAIWDQFVSYKSARFYVQKWHVTDNYGNWENFPIITNKNGDIDLSATLHEMEGEILLKMAIDLGVETPDFIPSIPTFRNEIKAEYKSASATFEKAFKEIETHPSIAVGLANSALESIIKEILKDERISSKIKGSETLYALATIILKEFRLITKAEVPKEIKTIGNSLLAISQSIEKLRSEKTDFHGKTDEDYIIDESLYTYFVVNSVATIGLFLNSFYKKKFPKIPLEKNVSFDPDSLPF